jgi:Outer membrane efflux protein
MRNSRNPSFRLTARQLGTGAIWIAMALGTQPGCTREFYREWANQDVSEAVFEKSRDPRWRIDVFSVEPPALSRYADPYDQEVPPAPPDDAATEALSPVPQWPDNRLLVPPEGTGYLDLLEYWRRDDAAKQRAAGIKVPDDEPEYWQRADNGRHAITDPRQPGMPGQPLSSPAGPPVAPEGLSPFSNPPPALPPGRSSGPGGASAPPGPQAANSRKPASSAADTTREVIRLQSDEPNPKTPTAAPTITRGKQLAFTNPGTNRQPLTPITLTRDATTVVGRTIPPPRAGASFSSLSTQGNPAVTDKGVSQVSYQGNGAQAQPAPATGPGIQPGTANTASPAQAQPPGGTPVPGQTPPTPGVPDEGRPPAVSPSNILDREVIAQPPFLNQRQLQDVGRMDQTEAAELSQIFVPKIDLQNDTEAYGYPKGSRVYKINMQQAWLLALMNARFYQFNLETVYLAALPVTQQRFTFGPQFYAGLSPVTSPLAPGGITGGVSAGFPSTPGVSTANTFTYATRFSPNGQISTLNMGTVAGVGKLFSTGGQLVMGFANEVLFNFVGKNPQQPTVISALPISFVQPLLRGGGRAVTLEPLTQAERNLLYAVRAFALFRQQFFVVTLTGGTVQNFGQTFNLAGFTAAGNTDPTIGFLPIVFNLVEVEVDRRNLAFLENIARLYGELIQGEASGLSRLQLDQVMQRVITGRQALFNDKVTYRVQLDEFKMQMGLPPDTPLVIDMSLAQPFYDVFNRVDDWQRKSTRSLDELPGIIAKLPELEDIDVEGRSVLGPYRNYRSTLKEFAAENEEGLEDTLQSAVRIALEYRMDLMNDRAQLYDAWRQIRVTANALKGVFNIAITNNVYTPTNPTNPFAFLSQAKNFGLSINAELPLVRIVERNAFREALITYQRTRRSLQTAEDNLKIQLRNDLRQVHLAYINYEIAKRNFELNVRLKDQAFEQIVAPPAAGGGGLAQVANAATQTTNLLTFQGNLITAMLSLTNGWALYQTQRLIVYRDIGILPYDEWEAFSELYPAQYHGPIIGTAPAGGAGFTPPPEARAATPESR